MREMKVKVSRERNKKQREKSKKVGKRKLEYREKTK